MEAELLPVIQSKREELDELCRRFQVKRMELFGSAARGDFDPERSDLDFLVEFERLPPAKYTDAYFSLKEALELVFGRPVDVVTKSAVERQFEITGEAFAQLRKLDGETAFAARDRRCIVSRIERLDERLSF